MTIPFIDLQSQRLRIGADIDAALLEVARSGQYIMGPAVAALERALCEFGQAPGAEAAERSGRLLTHGGQLRLDQSRPENAFGRTWNRTRIDGFALRRVTAPEAHWIN